MIEIASHSTCRIAFKEWAGVCRAIAEGRQTILVRKGGIAEGPGGFAPDHDTFWLYPTHVHEAEHGLKDDAPVASKVVPTKVEIGTLLKVVSLRRVDDFPTLERLDHEHVWTAETMRKRFFYRSPGLWLMIVRAFESREPRLIEPTERQAGCKSWVELETPLPTCDVGPVIDELRFESRRKSILAAMEPEN